MTPIGINRIQGVNELGSVAESKQNTVRRGTDLEDRNLLALQRCQVIQGHQLVPFHLWQRDTRAGQCTTLPGLDCLTSEQRILHTMYTQCISQLTHITDNIAQYLITRSN